MLRCLRPAPQNQRQAPSKSLSGQQEAVGAVLDQLGSAGASLPRVVRLRRRLLHGCGEQQQKLRPSSPLPSLSSGFSSEGSEEEDSDRVVEGDFVASDEAEARILAWMKWRSERAHFHEVAANDVELEEALRLIERQKAEERAADGVVIN